MRRVVIPELLDSDDGSPQEIAGSLEDLRFFNRRFGGISTTCALLQRVAEATGQHAFRVLEVAAASGDVPTESARRLRRSGIELDFTLLDRSPLHLPHNSRSVVADALALPFRDASFDLVSCGLFAHHLEPAELANFMREAMRVSRVALLVNDLIRHPVHLALVYLGMPLYRSRLTRNDAPASVRRAYTMGEMRQFLAQAGCQRTELRRFYLFRMGVIAWK